MEATNYIYKENGRMERRIFINQESGGLWSWVNSGISVFLYLSMRQEKGMFHTCHILENMKLKEKYLSIFKPYFKKTKKLE